MVGALLISTVLASACVSSDDGTIADASLQVTNESDFAIIEIYLTDVDSSDWGPNLLRGDVLLPGESLVLGVQCGFYDALLVDEDEVECELRDLDLCANDAEWVIGNSTCSVFGAAKRAREASIGGSQLDQLGIAR